MGKKCQVLLGTNKSYLKSQVLSSPVLMGTNKSFQNEAALKDKEWKRVLLSWKAQSFRGLQFKRASSWEEVFGAAGGSLSSCQFNSPEQSRGCSLQSWPHFLHDRKSNSHMPTSTLVRLELFLEMSQFAPWGSCVSQYQDGWFGCWVSTNHLPAGRTPESQPVRCPILGSLASALVVQSSSEKGGFQWNASSSELQPKVPSSEHISYME